MPTSLKLACPSHWLGLAVSARTEPRFTRDADLAVAVANDAEAEALIHRLRARDYGIEAVVEQEAVGRLATVRLICSNTLLAPVIDLLFASSGIEPEVVAEAEVFELLPKVHIRVATMAHLIAMKVLSRNDVTCPQDVGDLRALLRVASHADVTRARGTHAHYRPWIPPRTRSRGGDEQTRTSRAGSPLRTSRGHASPRLRWGDDAARRPRIAALPRAHHGGSRFARRRRCGECRSWLGDSQGVVHRTWDKPSQSPHDFRPDNGPHPTRESGAGQSVDCDHLSGWGGKQAAI
jgi:hypothetical protein